MKKEEYKKWIIAITAVLGLLLLIFLTGNLKKWLGPKKTEEPLTRPPTTREEIIKSLSGPVYIPAPISPNEGVLKSLSGPPGKKPAPADKKVLESLTGPQP